MSDTLATESTPLNLDAAAQMFTQALETETPEPEKEKEQPVAEPEGATEPEGAEESEAEPEAETEEPELSDVTIDVDGKPVTLTKEQLAEAYKSGLRQADYTKKTMEVSEQRKAADAEIAQARQARQEFAQKNAQAIALLNAQLGEQQNINWEQLLTTDPVEFMRQKHLSEQRQAALYKAQQDQQLVMQQAQAEQQSYLQKFVSEQQEQLIAKLPEWKDEAKAKAEKQALREFLQESGYSTEEISAAADHRMILIARDAMRFKQMMSNAKAAAKKVENVPNRVQRPSGGNAPMIDKRSAQYQQLSKTGSVEDAARLFASIL